MKDLKEARMYKLWLAAGCVALTLAVSTASVNGVETYQWTHNDHRIKIQTEGGKLELTDDWTGIARLSPGTKVTFEEDDGRTEHRLDVKAGRDGRPVYTWTVDGKERAFDAAGRQWLEDMLLRFVRGSGYDADRRVAWFLKNQGPDGLLAEISQITSDYGKSLYFQKLFAQKGLGAGVVERALRQAGREIGSDYELAQTLTSAVSAAGTQTLTEPLARAYAEAARSIGSDYEQRRALSALVAKARPSPAVLAMTLQTAQEIGSDYELASLLVEIAGKYSLTGAARDAYAETAGTIGSKYERGRAEEALRSGR